MWIIMRSFVSGQKVEESGERNTQGRTRPAAVVHVYATIQKDFRFFL